MGCKESKTKEDQHHGSDDVPTENEEIPLHQELGTKVNLL